MVDWRLMVEGRVAATGIAPSLDALAIAKAPTAEGTMSQTRLELRGCSIVVPSALLAKVAEAFPGGAGIEGPIAPFPVPAMGARGWLPIFDDDDNLVDLACGRLVPERRAMASDAMEAEAARLAPLGPLGGSRFR